MGAKLIKGKRGKDGKFPEGEIFCKWLESRLIRNNKNVLGANLGPTGSGKSYRDLRMAELWYKYHFNEPFPEDNICFGVSTIMQKLSSGNLRKGEVLIFEEAGANLNSLEFQNRICKMFTFVLQSFRSMNIAIFFNLPFMSMLNKQARMLMHYSFESAGIDFEKGLNKCKPFFVQVNQGTGKIYKKYPRINAGGTAAPVKRFCFSMPSPYLVNAYEKKKIQFLANMTTEYTKELRKIESDKLDKLSRPKLTDKEKMYRLDIENGLNVKQIAEREGISINTIYKALENSKKKGYEPPRKPKRIEK